MLIVATIQAGVELYSIPSLLSSSSSPVADANRRPFLLQGPTMFQAFSPNGECVYVHQPNVDVIRCPLLNDQKDDTHNDHEDDQPRSRATKLLFLANSQNVQVLSVSPLGTYLLTWEHWRSLNDNNHKSTALSSSSSSKSLKQDAVNLKVWKADSGTFVWGTVQKNLKREGWLYIQWTFDKMYAMLLTTNELRVCRRDNLAAAAETASATTKAASHNTNSNDNDNDNDNSEITAFGSFVTMAKRLLNTCHGTM